jgi:hypothetical protein
MRQPRSDAPSVVLPIIDREMGGVNARTLEERRKFGGRSLELLVPRFTDRRSTPPRAPRSISSERGHEDVRTIGICRFERMMKTIFWNEPIMAPHRAVTSSEWRKP